MSKYEKLEAEYNLIETPEQQWAWVLAHKDEVDLFIGEFSTEMCFKNDLIHRGIELPFVGNYTGLIHLLLALGIEAEEV
ncbi:MAG: hypothetical protein JWQ09_5805 [Segetibacter sp.]|nr:hypothetical protein [Segetibacter sp.]